MKVDYAYLHPTGGGETPVEGASIATLLNDMPNLFYFGYMPPYPVLNAFLAEGIADAGMGGGCRWKPFQISNEEYQALVDELRTRTNEAGQRPKRFDAVPGHVRTKNEWFAWVYHVDLGAPYEEALRHLERENQLKRARDAAYGRGAKDEGESLHWQWFDAATAANEFLSPYIERKGRAGGD